MILAHFFLASLFLGSYSTQDRYSVQVDDVWASKLPEFHNHGMLMAKHRFAVVAHRANHVKAPENSLEAIREAIRVGTDYVELDLRTTKDGEIVMMHDDTVDRTTDGHGRVRELTLAEIKKLHFKVQQAVPEQVPTFDEVLDTVGRRMRIYRDIKAVTPQQVLPYLVKHRMTDHVIAYCYGPEHVEQWRAGAPKIPVISDFDLKSPEQVSSDWTAHPFAIFDGPARELNADTIKALHQHRVLIWPDIQSSPDNPSEWQKYIDLGVDGFQTDHPEALVNYLISKGIR